MKALEEHQEAGQHMDVELGVSTLPLAANGSAEAPEDLLKSTWVQCDRCNKWRRVPKALADSLDEEKPWFCEDNPAFTFSSCSAEQELSNDEIDKTLQENEARDEEGSTPPSRKVRPAVWQLIRDNIFTHRARKSEKEDDIMVCQCTPPRDGGLGCREDCLNRMLNVECHPDFCPCGEQCSNTMFAKRAYAKLDKRRAGAKGFGLFTKQDLKEGQFIIEYIGEVLEEEEYVRRKMFYQEVGQRHYYFMNVGNGEVIDACRKGALGRFINHSCDPNCETQKWLVHGELCIGLFALKPVKADEELTFDYNFERYGDKPMHCYCNARSCRGFIGGTPEQEALGRDAEHQADASEDPEPIMLQEGEAANPALAAILASEVGLASADWQDDSLRRGWEELAAKKGLTLDWDLGADSGTSTSSAEEAIAAMAAMPQSPEAVEQRLKDSKAQKEKRLEALAAAKAANHSVPPRKRLSKANSFLAPGSGPLIAPTSSTTGQPSSTPVQRPAKWEQPAQKGAGRRSEVDRKLDNLVGPNGRLRDVGQGGIVRMLRLFNLCDLGPTPSVGPASPKVDDSEASSHANGSAGTTTAYTGSGAQANGTGELRSRAADSESYHEQRRKRRRQDGSLKPSRSRSRDRDDTESSPDLGREEGEIKDQPKAREPERVRERTPERVPDRLPDRDSDRQLTGRQRARMADLSLLLDVILKTSGSSAKKEFCRCGALRQIQSTLSRCMGPAYAIIIRKMLRAVDHLPLTADDLHQTSSAHGSFADMLKELTLHLDPDVRNRASALLKKHPWSACSLEVQQATQAATANRKRHGRPFYRGARRGWGDRERADRDKDGDMEVGSGGTPIYERTAKQLAARPHRPSRFHGPGEVPATWGPGPAQKAPERDRSFWSSPRPRGREAGLWQMDSTPSRIADDSRRQLASPLPSSSSVPPMGSHHFPSPAHPGWKGLHRLASSGPSSTLTAAAAAGWHQASLDRAHSPANDLAGMSRPGSAFDRLPPPPPMPVSKTVLSQPLTDGLPPPPLLAALPTATESARSGRGLSRWDLSSAPAVPAAAPLPWPRLPNGDTLSEASPMSAGLPEGSPLTPAHAAPERSAGKTINSEDSDQPPLPEGGPSPPPPLPEGSPMSPGPPATDAGSVEPGSVSPMSPGLPAGSPISPRIPHTAVPLPLQQSAGAAPSIRRSESLLDQGASLEDLASKDPAAAVTAVGWRKPSLDLAAARNDPLRQQRAPAADATIPLRATASLDELGSLNPDTGMSLEKAGGRFWDEPDASLEEFVVKEVQAYLKKYLQPDHPNRISREDFDTLLKKARRAIMEAERKAYKERQQAATFKPIDRQKIAPRIKEYVKESIKRHHERKAGGQS